MAELVDASDLKSLILTGMPVRFRLGPPVIKTIEVCMKLLAGFMPSHQIAIMVLASTLNGVFKMLGWLRNIFCAVTEQEPTTNKPRLRDISCLPLSRGPQLPDYYVSRPLSSPVQNHSPN